MTAEIIACLKHPETLACLKHPEILACLKHPEMLVINGAGHLPNLEAERELNDALRAFLRTHAPR